MRQSALNGEGTSESRESREAKIGPPKTEGEDSAEIEAPSCPRVRSRDTATPRELRLETECYKSTGLRGVATPNEAEKGIFSWNCPERANRLRQTAVRAHRNRVFRYNPPQARRDGRVAEGGGLLNRCRVKSSTGGSNPPLSARPSCIPSSHSQFTENRRLGRFPHRPRLQHFPSNWLPRTFSA